MDVILLCLCVVGGFLSCSENKPVAIDLRGVPTVEVHLEKLALENPPLYPKGCCWADSFLIVFDPKDRDGFLSVYEGNRLLGKYGTMGEGPDDFVNPRLLSNGKTIGASRDIQVGDGHAIYTLNVDAALAQVDKTDLPCTRIPKELSLYNYVLRNTDSVLVVQQTSDYQLSFYDKLASQTRGRNYFDRVSSVGDASDFCYATQIYDAYYLSGDSTLAIAYRYRKLIDVLSLSGEWKHRVYFPGYDGNDSKMSLENGNLKLDDSACMFFSFAAATDGHYYFLCWDDTKSNIRQGKAKTKIYETDLNGCVQAVIQLDKSISYVCLGRSYLYAIGLSEGEDMQFYYAPLPESVRPLDVQTGGSRQ